VVYGMDTPETVLHPHLTTSFHYDAIFGTSANRFSVQAAIGHPLSCFGRGTQKRAYISLDDMVRGIDQVIQRPSERGTYRVLYHFAETVSINALAERIQACALKAGLRVEIGPVSNPRVEIEEQEEEPEPGKLDGGPFAYTTLEDNLDGTYFFKILQAKDRIDLAVLNQFIPWKKH
jgi:UDP-sulfoquinovose synthase